MATLHASSLPRRFWVIAVLALAWNLLGVTMFAIQVSLSPETLAALPAPQRDVHAATPAWVFAAFGTAVFAGVFGAVGLLLRQRWAVALFGVSLAALVLQLVATYLLTPAWSAMGPSGLAMPALLLVIASLLLGHARTASRRGWLR